MYNFHLTRYYNVKSIIHNLNPLIKIICLLLFTTMVLISKSILVLSILLLFMIILIGMSNVPLNIYIKSYKYVLPFILFIFIINLIFSSLEITIISILKLILFMSYSTLILYTTKINDINYGLEKFLTPLKLFKVDTHSISLTISLAIHFIPTLFNEGERIYKSAISRGLNFKGNLNEKIDKLMSLVIPIFNMSLEKSERIADVLNIRLSNKRTKYKLYNYSSIDENILIIHIFMLLLLFVKEVLL